MNEYKIVINGRDYPISTSMLRRLLTIPESHLIFLKKKEGNSFPNSDRQLLNLITKIKIENPELI